MNDLRACLVRVLLGPEAALFREQLNRIQQELRTVSESQTTLATQIAGLRADVTAANERVAAHEAVRDQADAAWQATITTLQQQLLDAQNNPGDTLAVEAALQTAIAAVMEGRTSVQEIYATEISPSEPVVVTDEPNKAPEGSIGVGTGV